MCVCKQGALGIGFFYWFLAFLVLSGEWWEYIICCLMLFAGTGYCCMGCACKDVYAEAQKAAVDAAANKAGVHASRERFLDCFA